MAGSTVPALGRFYGYVAVHKKGAKGHGPGQGKFPAKNSMRRNLAFVLLSYFTCHVLAHEKSSSFAAFVGSCIAPSDTFLLAVCRVRAERSSLRKQTVAPLRMQIRNTFNDNSDTPLVSLKLINLVFSSSECVYRIAK